MGKKWISIKDIGNCGVYIFDTSEYLTDESVKKFNIPVIPENTTILSFKMTVGKLTITTEEMLSNEAIAHLKIKDNSNLTSEFIYCYLQALDFNSLGSTSSIVTAINSTMIKEIEVVVPDEITL
jgi:type I restriction enzyme S subunit